MHFGALDLNLLRVFEALMQERSATRAGERLLFHVSRGNLVHEALMAGATALFVASGPHAYISPDWYGLEGRVPTWNYVAVHAYGPVEFFDDAERLLDIVTRLTNMHEKGSRAPWSVSDAPEAFIRAQLKGIVGLRLPISRIEGKRKMSQNRSAGDRAGVAAGLAASERASDHVVAKLIPR